LARRFNSERIFISFVLSVLLGVLISMLLDDAFPTSAKVPGLPVSYGSIEPLLITPLLYVVLATQIVPRLLSKLRIYRTA
jgi:uncharacterized membrane protein